MNGLRVLSSAPRYHRQQLFSWKLLALIKYLEVIGLFFLLFMLFDMRKSGPYNAKELPTRQRVTEMEHSLVARLKRMENIMFMMAVAVRISTNEATVMGNLKTGADGLLRGAHQVDLMPNGCFFLFTVSVINS